MEDLPERREGAGIKEKKLKKTAVSTHDCCYEPASQHLGSESRRRAEVIYEQMHGSACASTALAKPT